MRRNGGSCERGSRGLRRVFDVEFSRFYQENNEPSSSSVQLLAVQMQYLQLFTVLTTLIP